MRRLSNRVPDFSHGRARHGCRVRLGAAEKFRRPAFPNDFSFDIVANGVIIAASLDRF
jgi:hypothetical protein